MTSLAYIFTMEKAPVKIIFGFIVDLLFVNRFPKLCGTFLDFWDAKG